MKVKIQLYTICLILFGGILPINLQSQVLNTVNDSLESIKIDSLESINVNETIEQPLEHSFDALVSNFNGYATNYLNVLDTNDNLLVKVLQKNKKVTLLLNGYSNSSITLLNAILNKRITDKEFIDDYLTYSSMPIIKELLLMKDSGYNFYLKFATTAPENRSLVSDISLLHQMRPDSIHPQDRIFYDAIKSAYVQLKESKFNTGAGNTLENGLNVSYPQKTYINYSSVQPLFEYFDTARTRILNQYTFDRPNIEKAFQNLKIKKYNTDEVEDIFFTTSHQKAALHRIWVEDPNAFIILEVRNDNISKTKLKNVNTYQPSTLIESFNSDKRFTQKLAAVGQMSLMSKNRNAVNQGKAKADELESELNAAVKEYNFGNFDKIFSYFDFLDKSNLTDQHYSSNNTNVWYPNYYSEDLVFEKEQDKLGTRLFLSVGLMGNIIAGKNSTALPLPNLPGEFVGVSFKIGVINENTGVYFSVLNVGSVNDLFFRHFEFSNMSYMQLNDQFNGVLSFSIPLRYTNVTMANPSDLSYFSSQNIDPSGVEVAESNGLSIGIGLKYMAFITSNFSIGIEGAYYSNSLYKTGWKIEGNNASNISRFNFRGLQLGLTGSLYFNNL